jgi:hypothetical protein
MKTIILILSFLILSSCKNKNEKDQELFFQRLIWQDGMSCSKVVDLKINNEFRIKVRCFSRSGFDAYEIYSFLGVWVVVLNNEVNHEI